VEELSKDRTLQMYQPPHRWLLVSVVFIPKDGELVNPRFNRNGY